ncbi:hypothetical protein JCM8202v2_000403 [Rhodotorula sphaerocarpa]
MAAVAGPSEIEAGSPVETRLWDALGRWSASVLVEGKAAEIYQVEHKPDSTACYIEAVDGKEFTAIFRRERADATDQSLHLCIDGSNVDAFFLNSGNKADAVFSGARVSALEERPFLFAPIPLTDDADQADANEAVIKGLGTIRFDVIDEKSKKATMGHSTAYGAPKVVPPQAERVTVDYIDGSPYHSFIFHYRSRAILELEGIVEPSAEAVALPAAADARESSSPPGAVAAGTSEPAPQKKKAKRRTIELTLSDSDSDDDGPDLRAKVARLEAENARLRGPSAVKLEGGRKVKAEKGVKTEKEEVDFKVTKKDGKVVLDILD